MKKISLIFIYIMFIVTFSSCNVTSNLNIEKIVKQSTKSYNIIKDSYKYNARYFSDYLFIKLLPLENDINNYKVKLDCSGLFLDGYLIGFEKVDEINKNNIYYNKTGLIFIEKSEFETILKYDYFLIKASFFSKTLLQGDVLSQFNSFTYNSIIYCMSAILPYNGFSVAFFEDGKMIDVDYQKYQDPYPTPFLMHTIFDLNKFACSKNDEIKWGMTFDEIKEKYNILYNNNLTQIID